MVLFERWHDFSLEQGHVFDGLFVGGISRSGTGNDVAEAVEEIIVGNQALNDGLRRSGDSCTERRAFTHARRQEPAERVLGHVARGDEKVRRDLERLAEEELGM